jgi:bacillopeptidase F
MVMTSIAPATSPTAPPAAPVPAGPPLPDSVAMPPDAVAVADRMPGSDLPVGQSEVDSRPPTGNVLIARLSEKADLSAAASMPRGAERRQAVYDALVETARTSQVDALAALDQLQQAGEVTKVESLFLPNAILVTTASGRHQAVADALAGVASVKAVTENRTWSVQGAEDRVTTGAAGAAAGAALLAYARGFIDGPAFLDPAAVQRRIVAGVEPDAPGPEWGVAKVRAPEAWRQGIDGSGVTIGIVDTGLDAEHPAIRPHYRGTAADGTISHDYHWYDPFQGRAVAYDDGGHGTHVAGSAAGGSETRAIGVAPGAKLIAAKAINGRGYNTTDATLKALQFMLAPTRTDGSDPNPAMGADVVNNSWGNADQADDTFVDTFAALKAAGIDVVSAAGNSGPREGTVSPPGSYPGYLSVAATTDRDAVASFSSRGPSRFARPDEMTPNVAAPGAGIVSAAPGGRYQRMSGTSMAAPHVAGAVALLRQAAPQATHEQLVEALTRTAVDIDRPGPDNASGFGRIDVPAAIDHIRQSVASDPDPE